MRVIARPIDLWPGEPTKHRVSAQFTAEWGDTLDLLEREVRALQKYGRDPGVEVIMQLYLSERDCRLDGGIRANASPTGPGAIISFDSMHGPLRYWADKYDSGGYMGSRRRMPGWQANVRAIALGLEALRKVERYGIAHRGEQYTGFGALPPGGIPMSAHVETMTVEDAARFLIKHGKFDDGDSTPVKNLLESDVVVDAYYRAAAKRLHPDAGGDPEMFRRLVMARNLLANI